MSKRSETTKPTKTAIRSARTRKSATGDTVDADDQAELDHFFADGSDLARLSHATDWASTGTMEVIFQAAPESITVYDTEGRIVRANATFHALLDRLFPGDRPAKLRDRLAKHPLRNPHGDVLPEEEWPQTRLLRGETLSGSFPAETMMYTSDGEAVHWSVTGAPLCTEDGQIIGAVAIHRDITAQKRLERELRQSRDELQAILEAVPDQVIVYDTDLHLIRSNTAHRAAEQRYYPGEQAPGELAERIERTQTVFRDLDGAPLPEGDWPQRRILRGETLSGSSAIETQAVTGEGKAQWWSVSGAPLRGEDGTITGAVLVNSDITRRKELEAALHRANERFQIAERAASGFVYEWDVRSGQLYRSAGVERVLGYQAEEIPPTWEAWAQLVYPGDWLASTDAEELAYLEALPGETLETEYRIRHRDGHYLTVADHAMLERDAAGHVIRLIGQTHDITERKRAEAALRESETRFRELADHAPLFIWVSDDQARISYANQSLLDYFGAPAQSLVETGSLAAEAWQRVVHPNDVAALSDHHQRGLREREGWEMEVRFWQAATDSYQWHLVKAVPRLVGDQFLGFIGVGININDRRHLEREAAERASLLEAVFAAAPDRITIFDETGQMVRLNPAAKQTAGTEREHATMETVGQVFDLRTVDGEPFPPDELPTSRALRGEIVQGVELLMRTAQGEQVVVTSSAPFYDGTGALRGAVALAHDVTATRTAQREAAQWAAQLEATFESLTDGAFLYDSSGQLLRMNQAARVIFALDAAPEYSALPPEERQARLQVRDTHDRPLAPEEWGLRGLARGERLMEPVELRMTALDGATKDLAITGGPVRASDGTMIGTVSLLRDVTQRRQMERAIAEQAGQLQATFDALADPICVFNAKGRILRQNRAEFDAFGFDTAPATVEDRALRIDLRDDEGRRIPPERLPARRVLTGETLVGIETILLVARGADGGDHWYIVGGAPIQDDAGQIAGGVIIFRDVTERRQLGQQTRWQASMLERAHDAIFMWELDGPILYWNHGAELLYGYSSEEAVGQISHRLLRTERPVSPAAFKKALKRDGEWIGDILHTTRDGRRIVVDSRHQLLTEPDGRRYVLEVCRDITERLELEDALRRSHDDLEQRVVERTQDLAQANTELRRLSQRVLEVQESERRVIARELHDEIGQALTGVKMMLELLESHADQAASASTATSTPLTAKRLPQLSEIRASVGETLQHVRDLSLDLRPAILDSMGLLPALVWQFERFTRQTGIVVKFHQTGLTHRLSLEVETAAYRIIQEALTNVARHAGVSELVVQIRVSEEALTLFVVDEGAGFDAERAVAATLTMGLAGMRERADLLGGTLLISSVPGEGTTIEAELPLITPSDAVDLVHVDSMSSERESGT